MKSCRSFASRAVSGFRNGTNGFSTVYPYKMTLRSMHDNTEGSRELKIGVQGAELFMGQRKRGVELGPKVLRETGLVSALENLGYDVLDYGNVPLMEVQQIVPTTGPGVQVSKAANEKWLAKNVKQVADASRLISEWTARTLRDGRLCLTLGGDHALGIGTVNGASQVYPDLGVLWIDAHSDINTPVTSGSGNMHGMSVSFIVKELQPYVSMLPEFSSWIQPRISASNMAFVGLRDIDPPEATILKMLGIAAYSMQDVDRHGIQKVTEMALDAISKGNANRPIHLSYDIDALCGSVVKSTGTPVTDGLSLREGIFLTEMIHDTGRLVSMDLVEVNPLLGTETDIITTVQAAKRLILGAFGYSRGGRALNSTIPKS